MKLFHIRENGGIKRGVTGENLHVQMDKHTTAFFKMFLQCFPGMASTDPEPEDKEAFIQAQLYDYHYKSALPSSYVWPKL
jgi:hypothetical protein